MHILDLWIAIAALLGLGRGVERVLGSERASSPPVARLVLIAGAVGVAGYGARTWHGWLLVTLMLLGAAYAGAAIGEAVAPLGRRLYRTGS